MVNSIGVFLGQLGNHVAILSSLVWPQAIRFPQPASPHVHQELVQHTAITPRTAFPPSSCTSGHKTVPSPLRLYRSQRRESHTRAIYRIPAINFRATFLLLSSDHGSNLPLVTLGHASTFRNPSANFAPLCSPRKRATAVANSTM